MSKLSKNIIDQIKKAEIKPTPKLYFIILNIALWTSLLVSVVLGGLSFSLVIRMVSAAPWDMVKRIGPSLIHSVMMLLPYLWILITLLLFGLLHLLIRYTKKGYRYSPIQIISFILIGSLFVGGLFYAFSVDRLFERYLISEFETYGRWQEERGRNWVSPERGLLTGFIEEVDEENEYFELEDLSHDSWLVDYSEVKDRGRELILPNHPISIIGEFIEDEQFKAAVIRPWERGGLHAPFRKGIPKHKFKNLPRPFEKNLKERLN